MDVQIGLIVLDQTHDTRMASSQVFNSHFRLHTPIHDSHFSPARQLLTVKSLRARSYTHPLFPLSSVSLTQATSGTANAPDTDRHHPRRPSSLLCNLARLFVSARHETNSNQLLRLLLRYHKPALRKHFPVQNASRVVSTTLCC